MKKLINRIIPLMLALIFICTTTAFAQGEAEVLTVPAPTDNNAEIEPAPVDNDEDILNYMEAQGLNNYEQNVELIIPKEFFLSEKEAGKLPGVTTGFYLEDNSNYTIKTIGVGDLVGRVKTWVTASDGYIRTGYKKGTYSSIASTALSFAPGIPAMIISAILNVVSMVVAASDTVSGETLVTYRYFYRDGEARWTSDPNQDQYWHLGIRTEKRETYKHVIGGKQNKSTLIWTFNIKNYNTTPAKTETSFNYTMSNDWLVSEGKARVATGNTLNECPW